TLASRMPALKAHAGLSDGLLGLALLGVPLGSILAVQVTGRWMARRGSAPVTVIGAVIMCATVVAPAYATSFALLAGALVLLGVGIGLTDTAMNAHAVLVEKGHARPIMASFHAFASLGNLVGAVLGAGAARLALLPQVQFPVVAAAALVVTLVVGRGLLPGRDDRADASPVEVVDPEGVSAPQRVRRPGAAWSGTLVLLAVVALLAWMSEHAVADWSAVYLRDGLGAPASLATYGYALFAAAMVLTRFLSDRVVARFGPRRVLRWGGLLAGAGLAVGLATGTVVGGVVGFGLVGIGMAGVVPVVFTAAGNQPGISAGHAVSKVAGVAFTGSLVGPPLIGLVADLLSLRAALLVVAVGAVLIGVLGPVALRAPAAAATARRR
ncbi:MAG: MFS transporter, partial [Janthinobacterium lividum]